jgi:hypothetical protein
VHPERQALEAAILRGEAMLSVANHYGLSDATVGKHKRQCMPAVVSAALTYRTVSQGVDTLLAAERVLEEARRLGELAEQKGELRTALLALREFARGTELFARLRGELQDTNSGPLTDPRWTAVRDAILAALQPYPEASRAVLAAMVRAAGKAPALAAPEPDE